MTSATRWAFEAGLSSLAVVSLGGFAYCSSDGVLLILNSCFLQLIYGTGRDTGSGGVVGFVSEQTTTAGCVLTRISRWFTAPGEQRRTNIATGRR